MTRADSCLGLRPTRLRPRGSGTARGEMTCQGRAYRCPPLRVFRPGEVKASRVGNLDLYAG